MMPARSCILKTLCLLLLLAPASAASGVPFGGACWIDELAYTVTDGACGFAPDRSGSSLFSSVDR